MYVHCQYMNTYTLQAPSMSRQWGQRTSPLPLLPSSAAFGCWRGPAPSVRWRLVELSPSSSFALLSFCLLQVINVRWMVGAEAIANHKLHSPEIIQMDAYNLPHWMIFLCLFFNLHHIYGDKSHDDTCLFFRQYAGSLHLRITTIGYFLPARLPGLTYMYFM